MKRRNISKWQWSVQVVKVKGIINGRLAWANDAYDGINKQTNNSMKHDMYVSWIKQ